MKVPSHVTVTVYEQQVLIQGPKGVKLQSFSPPQYKVETGLAYTDKVFLVDFVRPAGGTLSLLGTGNKEGIEFDDEQYFKSIQAKASEQTMEQVIGVLDDVVENPGSYFKKKVIAGETVSAKFVDPEKGLANVHFEDSIVAHQRFDLARPHWEDELNCFVAKYLGECGSCQVGVSTSPNSPSQNLISSEFIPDVPPALKGLE
ncbi:hypothetical protein [Gimesia aquarii]|nr:hypothetical protein [Gimesia aquarii]